MAFENIVGAKLQRRWMVTFGFGLIHGFGFSFLLRERLQFAGEHLLTSLLAFNVGVEIGQLAVLLVTIPALVAAVPLRRRRAHRHDPAVGAGRAHRVALGDRSRHRAAGRIRCRELTLQDIAAGVRLLMVIVAAAGAGVAGVALDRVQTRRFETEPS